MPDQKKYTDPELREEIKEEIKQGDKGGKPGQWSARKAQFLASEYKHRGGDYTTPKESGQDESQKSLEKWGSEEWQTKEGSGTAKQQDGTRKRYLPKKAWEELDEGEKQATEEKKLEGSRRGEQFVGNTAGAKRKRGEVSRKGEGEEDKKGDEDEGDKGKEDEGKEDKEDRMDQDTEGDKKGEGDSEEAEDGEEYREDGEAEIPSGGEGENEDGEGEEEEEEEGGGGDTPDKTENKPDPGPEQKRQKTNKK
ncbi:uncharacterized protein ACLA_043160 [Aspergillus clavatus NRRL 1]|uniref:DUF5872 domain-containing protein n=1 Tax=Aspergillus clavatus (strain ATCC 1007 / CBS 513.65 / DSM 816 / NCTC 3887 / NRRL 1 / QM 1276 / 107) TaxID=344612 RepID=A1C8G1_ASPCL|nr:uncharacterized protein ACLA_043160 [Aspergillus clavatus NRRL 1]EAW13598.1 hypothetical protein ACLA_043160 [Aspergillus clavatus NRRL 1]